MVYEILSIRPSTKWSEYDPTVVCSVEVNSMDEAVAWTNKPTGFVQMMGIDVYGIRDESGHINYTENYS